jgi:hypothetical protein
MNYDQASINPGDHLFSRHGRPGGNPARLALPSGQDFHVRATDIDDKDSHNAPRPC